jgi:UDP-N-acetylglucosamine--N-acetylmuramyl-(pentapeptide) pyrophosphoryl-undecaprenol N-acetylglucosamine transferase
VDATWVGSQRGMESRLVREAGVPFTAVRAAPIVGVVWWRLPWNAFQIASGTLQAWRKLRRGRPDAVLVTGGYVSIPVALAARIAGVPLAVFLPDVEPGRAVRVVARLAQRILTSRPESSAYLNRDVVVTGYPVRPEVRSARRDDARRALGLPEEASVVLAFGGSQGSRVINRAVATAAGELLERVHLVHLTGSLDLAEVEARRAELGASAARWHVHEYLGGADMALALAAADLVISRAGASILGEYPATGLPALLVPLGIAGGHQKANAHVLEEAGAALVIPNDSLDAPRLLSAVTELLDNPTRLRAMAEASRSLDTPGAADRIWAAVSDLAFTEVD